MTGSTWTRCPRCESVLHERKPDSVARTWALVIAAALLYIPANYYPVLTVMQLGAGQPSTILGGVEELVTPFLSFTWRGMARLPGVSPASTTSRCAP